MLNEVKHLGSSTQPVAEHEILCWQAQCRDIKKESHLTGHHRPQPGLPGFP
jgi:hypothetical protein